MSALHRAAVILAAALAASAAHAQQSTADELALFQLDALLSKETTIASRRAKTLRESPGVVTIVTRDEIRESGARDLVDVLMAVPGFQMGGEVQNTTGIGFRGMTASEGKVLVLVDGVVLNDLLYGGVQLDAFPIDDVDRVEVIRGPGSAMYGGFAELAVVNVITRRGAGAAVTATYGQMGRTPGRRSLSAAYGREGADWSVRAFASGGASIRGTGTYVDGSGASFSMADQSALDDLALNVGAAFRGLDVRVLHDRWRNETREGWGDVMPEPYRQTFTTTSASARYDLALAPTLHLAPELGVLRSTPWRAEDLAMDYVYDKTVDRYTGRLAGAWDPVETVAVTVGVEAYTEVARLNRPVSDLNPAFPGGGTELQAHNLAAYAEGAWDAPFANLLVGGRFEHHDRYGDSFVPRVALTKLADPFHLKLLYAHAFRAPAVENFNTNPGIEPERTRSLEAEVGWRAFDRTYLAVNAFYVRVQDAIVYTVDATGADGTELYRNYAKTGAHGLELDVHHEAAWGSAKLSYSFYTTAEGNAVDLCAVPGDDDRMLGFAVHKVTARSSIRFGRDVTVVPTLTYLSDRRGYTGRDADGALVLGRVGPKLTADLFLTWRDAFARGVELSAGVHDLFDAGTVYVTPYRPESAVHGFLPGPSREVMVRIGYGG